MGRRAGAEVSSLAFLSRCHDGTVGARLPRPEGAPSPVSVVPMASVRTARDGTSPSPVRLVVWGERAAAPGLRAEPPLETFRHADILGHGWAGALTWVTEVNILDPLTVEIRADSDVAKQLFLLSYLPIVPAHYWLERDVSETTLAPPLQSGPYRLTSVSQDRYLIYERVPDYWGRDLPVNRGKFNFDAIRYERYLDATVAREALRAGVLDVWTETDSRHWLASYDVPARRAGWLVLGRLRSRDQSGARYRLAMNTGRQPFDDLRVREARHCSMHWTSSGKSGCCTGAN